jgi:hypothetical protein
MIGKQPPCPGVAVIPERAELLVQALLLLLGPDLFFRTPRSINQVLYMASLRRGQAGCELTASQVHGFAATPE